MALRYVLLKELRKKTKTPLINNLKDFRSNIKGFQKGGSDRTYYKNI